MSESKKTDELQNRESGSDMSDCSSLPNTDGNGSEDTTVDEVDRACQACQYQSCKIRLPRSQKKKVKQEQALMLRKERRKEKKMMKTERARMENTNTVFETESHSGLSRREMREEVRCKLQKAMMCGQRICIDLSMENTMTFKEKSKLAQQLCRVHGANKHADVPVHVYFAGLNKDGDLYKECIRKNEGFDRYQIDMTDLPVTELFNIEDIIYLSPDAEEILTDLDNNKVYIIGGIVDESITKNLSKQKAAESKVLSKKLPIDLYMEKKQQTHFSQILSVNQVFEVLVTYVSTRDWKRSLQVGMPSRKGYVIKDIH